VLPRFVSSVLLTALLIGLLPDQADGQITAEELRKRQLFLRTREKMRTEPAPDRQRPVATPVPAPAVSATPLPPSATPPKAIPVADAVVINAEETITQRPTPAPTSTPEKTAAATPEETPEPTPEPTATPTPTPPTKKAIVIQQPTPRPKKKEVKRESAQVTVEKSGKDEERGFAPPIFSLFGPRWKYVTGDVKEAIDDAKVRRNRWKYIIIHNSATRQGNARIFERYHRNVRKMRNGMAYHFVIGNGTSTGDGEIEVGNRWVRQINGGHVASNYLNNIALGICLVGDFDRDTPTKRQRESLDELIRYLRRRVGRIDGKQSIVKGHREINPRPTSCPGKRFPLRWLHDQFD